MMKSLDYDEKNCCFTDALRKTILSKRHIHDFHKKLIWSSEKTVVLLIHYVKQSYQRGASTISTKI